MMQLHIDLQAVAIQGAVGLRPNRSFFMRAPDLAGLALIATLAAAQAKADSFTFSFTGTTPYSTPPGTISGEILGLADNGTSTPTDVMLFSDPDGIVTGDLTQLGWFTVAGQPDSFTVSDGVITGADFTYFDPTTNRELVLGAFGTSALINYINGDETIADSSGVTYTQSPVDEPGSLAVLGMGLVCVAVALPFGLKYGRIRPR